MGNIFVSVDAQRKSGSPTRAWIRLRGPEGGGRALGDAAASLLCELVRASENLVVGRGDEQHPSGTDIDRRLEGIARSEGARGLMTALTCEHPRTRFVVCGARAVGVVADPEAEQYDFDFVVQQDTDVVAAELPNVARWAAEHDVSVREGVWFRSLDKEPMNPRVVAAWSAGLLLWLAAVYTVAIGQKSFLPIYVANAYLLAFAVITGIYVMVRTTRHTDALDGIAGLLVVFAAIAIAALAGRFAPTIGEPNYCAANLYHGVPPCVFRCTTTPLVSAAFVGALWLLSAGLVRYRDSGE